MSGMMIERAMMIMKRVLLICYAVLICFLQSASVSAMQSKHADPNSDIDIFTLTTKDKIFSATLDGNLDITLYLTHQQDSEYHGDVYAVSGWYYYDKYKKKIDLVGFNFLGELHLFNTNDRAFRNKLMTMSFPWSDIVLSGTEKDIAAKNRTKWQEYLLLSPDTPEKNKWQGHNKTFSISHHYDDLRPRQAKQYLKLGVDKNRQPIYKHLDHLRVWWDDLKLESYKRTAKGTHVLASFENVGNINPNGRCGGGEDVGYMHFLFDTQNRLVSRDEVLVASCAVPIEISQVKKINNKQGKRSKYIYEIDDDGVEKRVIVDFESATFTK